MANDISSGVIGIIGALVGGSATAATSWISARSQSKREREKDQEARLDKIATIRRDACVVYISCVDRLLEDARALSAALDGRVDDTHFAELHNRYEEEWRELTLVGSPLQIMGPAKLASIAQSLRIKIGGYCDLIDDRRRTGRRSSKEEQARVEVRTARTEFVDEAQLVFDAGQRKAAE
jgi:hypothetical protein